MEEVINTEAEYSTWIMRRNNRVCSKCVPSICRFSDVSEIAQEPQWAVDHHLRSSGSPTRRLDQPRLTDRPKLDRLRSTNHRLFLESGVKEQRLFPTVEEMAPHPHPIPPHSQRARPRDASGKCGVSPGRCLGASALLASFDRRVPSSLYLYISLR